MARIEIYTTDTCPFCARAKALLKAKHAVFEETDVTMDAPARQAMKARAGGRNSVPQIFLNGVHIGGCDDLHALDAAGKLDAMLAA